MNTEELHRVIAAWLDGRITEAESATLEKELRDSLEARTEFRRWTELDAALTVPEDTITNVYLARIRFAKAELARLMRSPTRNSLHLSVLAGSAKPEDLGPILLSIVGQYLVEQKEYDKAAPFFMRLRDTYPDSAFSDAAPVGLGEIAMAKGDYAAAAEAFDFALNGAAGTGMAKEATFGKAVALFNLKKFPEAKAIFEEIVGIKEWRGLEKAGALFYLGEIAAETGDKGEANAYFQRVYLSHAAQVDFARKASLRSADMLEADGQKEAAERTLRELIKNPKHSTSEEAKTAMKRLGI